jgi:hypothetical protein
MPFSDPVHLQSMKHLKAGICSREECGVPEGLSTPGLGQWEGPEWSAKRGMESPRHPISLPHIPAVFV